MLKNRSVTAALLSALLLSLAGAAYSAQTPPKKAKIGPAAAPPPPKPAPSGSSAARVLAALEKSGHTYRKVDEGIWAVGLSGKNIKEIAVVVVAVEDSVLVQAQLAGRKDLSLKEALLVKLLELNHEYDASKLALSEEMLYARTEMRAKLVDAKELDYLITQVAALADEAYPQIKPFVVTK